MSKKGFTIVELLAAVAIIAIVSGVGMISYSSLINRSADKVFEEYQDSLYAASYNYLSKNINKQSVHLTFPLNLKITDLKIDPIKNPRDKNQTCVDDSYIMIAKNANCDILSFSYEVCLKCGDDYDNCKTYFDKDC